MQLVRALPTASILVVVIFTAPASAADDAVSNFFKKVVPDGVKTLKDALPGSEPPSRGEAAPNGEASKGGAVGASSGASANELKMSATLKSNALANNRIRSGDVAADRQCRKPEENFDIFAKATEFAGEQGSERLRKLIDGNGRYEDISPEDEEMLRYLARTTVWVPIAMEEKVVATGDFFSSKGKGSTPLLEAQRVRVEQRANRIKGTLADFPGDIKVKLDPELPDGAFARFGNDVVVSPDFASRLGDFEKGGDFVVAHELSHVYKRHPIKKLQFDLISTSEGWKLARKLLARMTGRSSTNVFSDMTDLPALYSAVKSTQLTFSQEQEFEADACTAVWLGRIGDDPRPAWKAFVSDYAAKDQQPTSYGSTHPPTALREKNYELKVAELNGPAKSGVASAAPPAKKGRPK